MGHLRVLKATPLATIQDYGRFGYRKYGIPYSGAMDVELMNVANHTVGNEKSFPVLEFALGSLEVKALAPTIISIAGTSNFPEPERVLLEKGQKLETGAPLDVYGYLSMRGLIAAKKDFGSYSTYIHAGLGGIQGRSIKVGDTLISNENSLSSTTPVVLSRIRQEIQKEGPAFIRVMKGPEWHRLKESPTGRNFTVHPSSNRMGVRLTGAPVSIDGGEITTSAVVPGTIQLPAEGLPIVLMNDCQTTGGYPRIAIVHGEYLGKLAQVKAGHTVQFLLDEEA